MSSRIKSFFRRLSKDHGGAGGGKSHQTVYHDPEGGSPTEAGRKASSTAFSASARLPNVAPPSKRKDHTDGNALHSSDDENLNPSSKEETNKLRKHLKYKKISVFSSSNKRDELDNNRIADTSEKMDVDSKKCTVEKMSVPADTVKETTAALKCAPAQTVVVSKSSTTTAAPEAATEAATVLPQVSATITINSIVPELSSTATPAVDASSSSSHNLPRSEPMARRNSKDVTDNARRQVYGIKQASTAMTSTPNNEPVKSVSITKLENNDLPVIIEASKKLPVSATTSEAAAASANNGKTITNHRKVSPSKTYHVSSSDFTPTISSNKQSSDDTFNTRTNSSTNNTKKQKKDPTSDEDANAKFQQEKMSRMEKMVSDLVKNAEVKKQEIAALRMEIKRLKEAAAKAAAHNDQHDRRAPLQPPVNDSANADRMEELVEENRALRSQLLHFGGSLDSSRLSDQEKEALLKGGSWGERSTTGATVGDWDAKSSSSEVSVACLQDRIMQMEETHYCTNEELQATLQELEDLRDQLCDSQSRLQTLNEDKQVVVDALHEQTNNLEVARFQNSTFKQLLIQHSENSHSMSNCVSSQKLLELLKTVEEDHERLLGQQDELNDRIACAEAAENKYQQDAQLFRDRLESYEVELETGKSDRSTALAQVVDMQETLTVQRLDTARLTAALGTAKEKISELEARVVGGGEVGELLEVVRGEKERLEQQVTDLTQQLHAANNDTDRIREQLHQSKDKLQKAESRARAGVQDASERSERLEEERRALVQQATDAEAALADARSAAQRHLHTKRELKTQLSDMQKKLTQSKEAKQHAEEMMAQQKDQFDKQVEEWEQFQCDLLTTVRVANDFKTEAQAHLEKVQQDNTTLKNQLAAYEKKHPALKPTASSSDRRASEAKPVKPVNPDRPLVRADSRVKSLIESLEGSGGSSSTPRCRPTTPDTSSPTTTPTRKVATPLLKRPDTESVSRSVSGVVSSPLKESGNIEGGSSSRALRTPYTDTCGSTAYTKVSQPPSSPTANLPDTVKMSQLGEKANSAKLDSKQPISILSNKVESKKNSYKQLKSDKKDPLAILAQGGGSKRNALLKWCQSQTLGYTQVDITNFSSSWNDGLAFCAILDTYIPDKITYRSLNHADKRANFEKALAAAESVGISSTLDINDMMNSERPNWQAVYNYVTSIYAHFET